MRACGGGVCELKKARPRMRGDIPGTFVLFENVRAQKIRLCLDLLIHPAIHGRTEKFLQMHGDRARFAASDFFVSHRDHRHDFLP